MFAILISRDGRGGHFYMHEGTTIVAVNDAEKAYLQKIANHENAEGETRYQLVELGSSWPFDTICAHQIDGRLLPRLHLAA